MHLKYILRQIESDFDNIRQDRSPFCGSLQTLLGTSMPSGRRLHHQSRRDLYWLNAEQMAKLEFFFPKPRASRVLTSDT